MPSDAPLEFEASSAIEQRVGRSPRGIFVPAEVFQQRAITKAGGGADLVGVDHLSGSPAAGLFLADASPPDDAHTRTLRQNAGVE
jgi:hypothetical protein